MTNQQEDANYEGSLLRKIFSLLLHSRSIMHSVSARERQMMHDYFVENRSLLAIGKEYEVSRERARQIIHNGLDRLTKTASTLTQIIDDLDEQTTFQIKVVGANKLLIQQQATQIDNLKAQVLGLINKLEQYEPVDLAFYGVEKIETKNLITLQTPLSAIDFTVRATKLFDKANLKTVYDLTQLTEAKLLKYKGTGYKTTWEIREFLALHGFSFKEK